MFRTGLHVKAESLHQRTLTVAILAGNVAKDLTKDHLNIITDNRVQYFFIEGSCVLHDDSCFHYMGR